MKLTMTHRAQQITKTSYLLGLSADTSRMSDGKQPRMHSITPRYLVHSDQLLGGADQSMRGPGGMMFYDAPRRDGHHQEFEPQMWTSLVETMSEHFLGSTLYDVKSNPDRYAGLPFWSLVLFGNRNTLFPPHLIPTLDADISNVISDQSLSELESRLHGVGLSGLFIAVTNAIINAHRVGGSFFLDD